MGHKGGHRGAEEGIRVLGEGLPGDRGGWGVSIEDHPRARPLDQAPFQTCSSKAFPRVSRDLGRDRLQATSDQGRGGAHPRGGLWSSDEGARGKGPRQDPWKEGCPGEAPPLWDIQEVPGGLWAQGSEQSSSTVRGGGVGLLACPRNRGPRSRRRGKRP